MNGLVPFIHVFLWIYAKTWMAATSAAMTCERIVTGYLSPKIRNYAAAR